MLKKVGLVNSNDERLMLELKNPDASGLLIKDIDGIGSLESAVSTTTRSVGDGTYVRHSRLDERNITITLAYIFSSGVDHTIEDTRDMLYKYIVPGAYMALQLLTDNKEVYIQGYVETDDSDIFQHSTTTSFSILCPDPYFYDISEEVISLPVKSVISDALYVTVPNKGNVPCGCTIKFTNFSSASKELALLSEYISSDKCFYFDISGWSGFEDISQDNIVTWCSIIGSRTIDIDGESILYLLHSDIKKFSEGKWFQIPVGGDRIGIKSETDDDTVKATIYYRQKYLGV